MDSIFLSCVASNAGDDGYPLEVGWAFADGHGEGHWIRPPAEWLRRRHAWDSEAEAVHGLTRDFLALQGELPVNVATRMNAALAGRTLWAVDPAPGDRHLGALFAAAGLRPAFKIAATSAESAIVDLARRLGVRDEAVAWAAGVAAREVPKRHRALPDALYWATLWGLVALGPDALKARGRASDL